MYSSVLNKLVLLTLISGLMACGGGGGGSSQASDPPEISTPAPVTPEEPPESPEQPEPEGSSLSPLASASRLASRATFGLDYKAIESLAALGEEAWLEGQFELPVGYHEPIVSDLLSRKNAGEFAEFQAESNNIEYVFRRLAWWQQAVYAPDVLRQRVAFALSEIFVVSDKLTALAASPYALSNYQDMLLVNAFGNYRDLLQAVTLHPAMGIYLSHVNNAKANPQSNTYPDENYAREVMQLFTIGLFELNQDGTEKTDEQGQPIATYDNTDISAFARVFTGLSFGGDSAQFYNQRPAFRQPMRMFDSFHDREEKVLLNGTVLPAGQSGMQDINAALDNLFEHPNLGPFIGRQLIQRLVTSNPSAEYVARVSAAFNGDTGAPRGDMKTVLRAILLDPEAMADPGTYEYMGKLREPILRALALIKNFSVASPDGFYASTGMFLEERLQQHPLSSPSVFNFFLPSHAPVGDIASAGLVAPEFQLTNSGTIVAAGNVVDAVLFSGIANDLYRPPFQSSSLDLSSYLDLNDNVSALLDKLDTLMTYNTMSDQTRQSIADTLLDIEDPALRVQTAIYLIFISPDYAVQI